MLEKKIAIIGTGGFAREVLCLALDVFNNQILSRDDIVFVEKNVEKKEFSIMGFDVIPFTELDTSKYNISVAVGDPKIRKNIVENELGDCSYITLIHPSAIISKFCSIGVGTIICAGVIITCNINIGAHSHINLSSSIGHDCDLKEYFTAAPGVRISGACSVGENVYFGTNSSIRHGLHVCDNAIIGMGAVVVKPIIKPGTYVGNPARLINE